MYNMQLSVLSLLKHFLHLFHCCFQKVQICILAVNKVKTWQSSPTLVLAFFQTWKQGIVQIISPHPLWLFLLHLFLELTKIYLAKINKGHTNIVYVFLKTIFFPHFFLLLVFVCLPHTCHRPAQRVTRATSDLSIMNVWGNIGRYSQLLPTHTTIR